ncbi:MAG: HNH endonuclease [Lachnospiraceae bacterium]|nr:HNH endonuclease [Lachnospiraceae bacterium]
MVYVIGQDGQPLMPTNRHGKVKHLLKDGKAKVVRTCPFTIKLLYRSTNYTQNLTLGQDTGSGTHGNAVYAENGKIIYMSKVIVRNDITDRMTQRAKYRRSRRNRKTRYRKPRFLNRKNSIRNDRFSPTMVSKIQSHKREIDYIKSILPITTIVLETGQFDTHLMKNPMLANEKVRHWGYQKGTNYGFENTKAFVLFRDNYTCQCCKGKHKDSKLEVHHKVFRSQGGSDEADNLITLCHTCHKALHAGNITPNFTGKYKGQLKYATQMNSIRKQLLRIYPDAIETFGMVTKANRLSLGIEKDHHIDACVIASGGSSFTFDTDIVFIKKNVAKGDYQKTKGIRSEQPITTGKIQGFRKFDKVKYFGKEYFIKGRMSTGYAILMDIEGNKIDFSSMPRGMKTPKLSNCIRVSARSSVLVDKAAI